MRAVFIGGCPRSGTTLLGAMLGGHSECITTPESQFKMDCLWNNGDKAHLDLRAALCMLAQHPRFKLWGVPIDLNADVPSMASGVELLLWLVRRYAVFQGKPSADIWIDHTGRNSKFALTLLQHFEEARFVHLVRDGRAVAASVLPLDWGPNTILRAAHWWTEQIAFGLASESHCGGRAIRVSFESLVTDPEQTLRVVCQFLDLKFESKMLGGDGFDVPNFTRSQHQLVGRPPDSSRAQQWEDCLSPRQIETFEILTADLLKTFGYPLKYDRPGRRVRWTERTSAYVVEAIRGLALNRIRHHRRIRRYSRQRHHQNGVDSQSMFLPFGRSSIYE